MFIVFFNHLNKNQPPVNNAVLICFMHRIVLILIGVVNCISALSQSNESIVIKLVNLRHQPLMNANVELLKQDSSLIKIAVSDSAGLVIFRNLPYKNYLIRTSLVGYVSTISAITSSGREHLITMQQMDKTLTSITITTRKPFIELRPDMTVINLEAGIANVGTTALEALEKLPGVTIDKDGNISLKGRSGVMVMLDGKPTYLSGAELSTLLSGMSASQIAQVELMDNPPAKYDAAGNAGIINIKTKKNNQRGFNGAITTAYAQGYYPKNNNNFSVNYRWGKWNVFANYNFNLNYYFTRIYALRTYFKADGVTIASLLEQPSFLKGSGTTHSLKTGIDYTISPNTSVGITIMGLDLSRHGSSNNPAQWMKPNRQVDSLVNTISTNNTRWDNLGAAFHFRHNFSSAREISADFDAIGYRIRSDQFFENNSVIPGNYSEASLADIPTDIRILSAKADYIEKLKTVQLEGGWKTSNIKTDNEAAYYYRDAGRWKDDLGRSNHFIYEEDIHAVYGSAKTKLNQWSLTGGLRYEMTSYDAKQLGNALVKDSSFSRQYNSLFPSFSVSFEKDSAHTFSLNTSRRIDRPAFQKLNPFLFIINKYTYQRGNPFYRPQYTWNIALNHLYKNLLITSISYNVTTDYFSQIFPIDSTGIVLYTEGNLGKLQNLGVSIGLQLSPLKWWSFSLQTVVNRKRMEGFITSNTVANITQYNINLNNQFRFQNGWSGELSGFYNSTSQHDIQEIVDPAGQFSIGISKSVFNNQGTLKLAVRDIFYTNWMKGLTYFNNATEYFKLTRDTRVATISFLWRFGKMFKTNKRSEGASGDEVQRVGAG